MFWKRSNISGSKKTEQDSWSYFGDEATLGNRRSESRKLEEKVYGYQNEEVVKLRN